MAWYRHVIAMIVCVCVGSGAACRPQSAETGVPVAKIQLDGAGATFPAPLYRKWIEAYRDHRPGVEILYDAVGSGEGIRRFAAGEVHFGASDSAMGDREIAAVDRGVLLIPVTAGSIAVAYNLPSVSGEIHLSRDVVADLFLGELTRWNDPRICELNSDLELPDRPIQLVARLDSSGTTYAFTNHLAAVSERWTTEGPGSGKQVRWPAAAMLANGNDGVAAVVKRTIGAIAYVEFGTAERAGLTLAALENKSGNYVTPSAESGLATLHNAELPADLRAFFPDPAGDDSYPIVTYTWLLLYREYESPKLAAEMKSFVTWCLADGQQYCEQLGYIRLASEAAERGMAALDAIR